VRNERVNKMSKFSLDSMRGDGKFVSILSVVCLLYSICSASNIYFVIASLAPLTTGRGVGNTTDATVLLPIPITLLRVLPHTRGTRRGMMTGGAGGRIGRSVMTGGIGRGSMRGRLRG
jgi:hypothetical protein